LQSLGRVAYFLFLFSTSIAPPAIGQPPAARIWVAESLYVPARTNSHAGGELTTNWSTALAGRRCEAKRRAANEYKAFVE
jgi:hypothetical protein